MSTAILATGWSAAGMSLFGAFALFALLARRFLLAVVAVVAVAVVAGVAAVTAVALSGAPAVGRGLRAPLFCVSATVPSYQKCAGIGDGRSVWARRYGGQ